MGMDAEARESRTHALAVMPRVAGNRSSFYVLRELANCYETFGRMEARRARVAETRSWYEKSLAVWNEWQSRGPGDAPRDSFLT